MGKCSVCGNEYDKAFSITRGNDTRVFDSFECAIYAMAPECFHCRCRIIGHGLEANGKFYCCAHCAAESGHREMKDRSNSPPGQ